MQNLKKPSAIPKIPFSKSAWPQHFWPTHSWLVHVGFFIISSLALYLPMSPILSKFGMSVCPVLKDNGFIGGCELNFKFIMSQVLVTAVLGSLLMTPWIREPFRKLFGPAGSILQGLVFIGASVLSLFVFSDHFAAQVAALGTAFNQSVANALLILGAALLTTQAALLDFYLLKEISKRPIEPVFSRSRIWMWFDELPSFLLGYLAPIIVLGLYLQLSNDLFMADVDGWSTAEGQIKKLSSIGAITLLWSIINRWFLGLSHWQIMSSIETKATEIFRDRNYNPMNLERTGILLPICQAINDSANSSLEKERLVEGFSKFVSSQVVDEIIKANQSLIRGQRVWAGIIALDLRNFTSLSENLTPDQVFQMLNVFFIEMIQVLNRSAFTIDKLLGDGILAYRTSENGQSQQQIAEQSFQTAQQVLEAQQRINQKYSQLDFPQVTMGVGVHCGEIIMGTLGSEGRLQHTILGEHVNRAFRIESACKDLGVQLLVSDRIVSLLPQTHDTQLGLIPHQVSLKGFSESMTLFSVKKFSSQSGPKSAKAS